MNTKGKLNKMTIIEIATDVRKELERKYGGKLNLAEKCLPASRTLKDVLIKHGYTDAIVVQGVFRVDNPDPAAYENWDVAAFESPEEMEEAKYTPLHYWGESQGFTIDITGDQFNNELDKENHMPPVFVQNISAAPKHITITKDWI